MSTNMHDAAHSLRRIKSTLAAMPPGAERDHLLGNFIRFCEKLRAFPSRVASFAPFKSSAEARDVMEREARIVLAELDRAN